MPAQALRCRNCEVEQPLDALAVCPRCPVEVGRDDRVVLLVTGDGLKTPGAVAHVLEPVEIEPDAGALLDRIGVAA